MISPLPVRSRLLPLLTAVVLAFPCGLSASTSGPVRVEGQRVLVETSTLSAVLERGALVSLTRKSDGAALLSGKPAGALSLIYTGDEIVPLGGESGDRVSVLQLNGNLAHVRVEGWFGDGVIAVSTDPANGDLLVEPSGYASRPGLKAVRWSFGGIATGLDLVAPFYQGARLALEDPLAAGKRWRWPFAWEAGLVLLQGTDGGFWVHCRDSRFQYKALQVGFGDDPRGLGFDTELSGPHYDKLAAGGLAWRINVYKGGWQVPAAQYRDWLSAAYNLGSRSCPAWVDSLRLALSWAPTEPALLDALAKWVKPGKVLLHIPDWRKDGYDENYPDFIPSPEGRAFVEKARSMGFRAMPHCNSIDMDPTNPVYNYVRDFVYRENGSGKIQGWSWVNNQGKPVPESNAERMRHRSDKTMVKIHPGLSMWRSILAERVQGAASALSLETVFLDVTLCCWNIRNGLVEDCTPAEGMLRLEEQVGGLNGGLVVGGEGRNEITMQAQALSQVHLFESWQTSREGLERLKPVPLNEFLFGRWSRSFGYSGLNGKNEDQARRIRLHQELGAIPTLTVDGAGEISSPNAAVRAVLEAAGK